MPMPKDIKDEMGFRRIGRSQITTCFDGGEVFSDGADVAARGYEDCNDHGTWRSFISAIHVGSAIFQVMSAFNPTIINAYPTKKARRIINLYRAKMSIIVRHRGGLSKGR